MRSFYRPLGARANPEVSPPTIKTTKSTVKLKGSGVGTKVVLKYKAKPGKSVTKKGTIKANGQWQFKFKSQMKKTVIKYHAITADGSRSKTEKVKVMEQND